MKSKSLVAWVSGNGKVDADLGARVDASVDVKLQLVAILQLEAEASALLFQAAPVQDGIVFVFMSSSSCICLSVFLSLSTCAEWQFCRTRSLPRPCSASKPGLCGPACAAAPGPKCTLIGKHLTIPKVNREICLIGSGTPPGRWVNATCGFVEDHHPAASSKGESH